MNNLTAKILDSYKKFITKYCLYLSKPILANLDFMFVMLFLWLASFELKADVETLHRYANSSGQEIINIITTNKTKLFPLLPPGYKPVSAFDVGFGNIDQGIIVIANFQGIDPTVDHLKPLKKPQVAIDVAILVEEPLEAKTVGVNIQGAFHVYALGIYTNDARYAASLKDAGMPVTFIKDIQYQRDIDDDTGIGSLLVDSTNQRLPFHTYSESEGYFPMLGAFNAVFWYESIYGTSILHFLDSPFSQGNALGNVYTESASEWDDLIRNGGLGECHSNMDFISYNCILAPSINLKYKNGSVGNLMRIR